MSHGKVRGQVLRMAWELRQMMTIELRHRGAGVLSTLMRGRGLPGDGVVVVTVVGGRRQGAGGGGGTLKRWLCYM